MHANVYIYTHICIYIHICLHIYTYIARLLILTNAPVLTFLFSSLGTPQNSMHLDAGFFNRVQDPTRCGQVYLCMWVCNIYIYVQYVRMYIYVYIYLYLCMYIYECIYIYIYAHTHARIYQDPTRFGQVYLCM